MDDPKVEAYLKRKSWQYRRENDQWKVKVCPFCGSDEWKFYVSAVTGQFICFKATCGKEGNLYVLKKELGDIAPVTSLSEDPEEKISTTEYNLWMEKLKKYHKNLLNADAEIKNLILEKWNYELETVKEFRLGIQFDHGKTWLVIPYKKNGRLANAKFRTLPPAEKEFHRIKGMGSELFNIDNIDHKLKHVILCEGESDCINLHQLGFKNVIGTSVGARGFKPEWKDFLDRFETVYLFYDNDLAGQDGARKMASRIGVSKCKNVLIPSNLKNKGNGNVKDLTEYIISGATKDDVKSLLKISKLFDVDDVVSLRGGLESLEVELFFNRTLDKGLRTPWDKFNKLIGGFVPGDLIILSGVAKIGKSTWALNLLLNYALQRIPAMYYCLEMRVERIVPKVISYFRMVQREQITTEDVIVTKAKYGRMPFYMAHSYKFTVETVFDTIRESVQRYGIEFLCFDHLHFLVRSLVNTTQEVGNTVRSFKLLAEELKIPILLIAQPRKLQSKTSTPTTEDLRDSSSIGQDADTVIIINRKRLPQKTERSESVGNLYEPYADCIVDATRYNPGGVSKLYYDGALSRYFNDIGERNRIVRGGEK